MLLDSLALTMMPGPLAEDLGPGTPEAIMLEAIRGLVVSTE